MIFVTVGSAEPFERLLLSLPRPHAEEIVAQTGPSRAQLPGVDCTPFMSFEQLMEAMGRARVVVAHAGVGTVLAALSAGKRPVLVPRRRECGEAVDDHQVELAHRLASEGLARVVDDPGELTAVLAEEGNSFSIPVGSRENTLSLDIRRFIDDTLAPPR